MKLVALCVSAAMVLTVAACTRAAEELNLIELQRVRSGDLDVVLLSNDGTLSHGKDSLFIEFRRGADLVDVGTVKAGATMVMAGMAPMMGSVFLERAAKPGRYKADTDLSMSGGWQLKLEWDGPAGKGMTTMQATAD
jgi:hypothetical protein